MWASVSEEMEPVKVLGKKAYLLSCDHEQLFSAVPPERELLLLGGHDPFLDQRDRLVLHPDKSRQIKSCHASLLHTPQPGHKDTRPNG